MKIGYICAGSLLQHYGVEGGAVHIQEVCRALQKLGHDVFIMGGKLTEISRSLRRYEAPMESPFKHPGDSVRSFLNSLRNERSSSTTNRSLNPQGVDYSTLRLSMSLCALLSDLWEQIWHIRTGCYFYHQALRIVRTEKPDVLYERGGSGSFAGVKLANQCGIPLILELNGSHTFRREWRRRRSVLYPWMVRKWERGICRIADAVVVVTPFLKQHLVKLGISDDKIFVLPNGVDINKFYPDDLKAAAVRHKYAIAGKRVVGFIGGLRRYHGVDTLIDSARFIVEEYPDVHFLIVGDGPPRVALEKRAHDQGLADSITFTGSVPHQDVPAFINAMDVAVAPFARMPDFYFSPIKVFEYMAVAKPVVASRYPDTESVITDHHSGLLVEPGNPHQLASAILELLEDKDLRERLGAEGRRMVEVSTRGQNGPRVFGQSGPRIG